MPIDAPAFSLWVQPVIPVEGLAVASTETTELAAGDVDSATVTSQTYATLSTWTITAAKVGELKEILVISSNYAKTLLQVTIAGVVYVTGWAPQAAMPLIFEDLKLAAAVVVLVEVKSSDGTSITVDCVIVGKEIG